MKENNSKKFDIKNNKFMTVVAIVVAILIGIVAFADESRFKTGAIEIGNEVVESEDVPPVENEIVDAENTPEIVEPIGEDIVIGGEVLTDLSGDEKVEKANEIVMSKEFSIDDKIYKATDIVVENIEDNYVFYNVADIIDPNSCDLMLINLEGDIENNLPLSFLTTYYYMYYFNLYGEELDTEFAPIDVQQMGNTFVLTNEKVTYDFKYSYEVNGDTYIFKFLN